MEKHFLLTIGDERLESHNLAFVCSFFEDKRDIRLTLFYVNQAGGQPEVHSLMAQEERDVLSEAEQRRGQGWLDEARDWAVAHGFAPENVLTRVAPQRFGTVKDIITEGHEGLYDAVLLGRRGLSWFEEYFTDSVTRAIIWEKIPFPLWISRMPQLDRTDVLLCVDGTGECLRMADHVGFILGHEPRHHVTILHIRERGKDADAIVDSVRHAIMDNGVAEDRLRVKVVRAPDKAGAILKEAREGRYAVVAVGRRQHAHPTPLQRVFIGSVSLKLLDNTEDFTLWLSK
jgi:nucleotide-binding universal stress UspA family protein